MTTSTLTDNDEHTHWRQVHWLTTRTLTDDKHNVWRREQWVTMSTMPNDVHNDWRQAHCSVISWWQAQCTIAMFYLCQAHWCQTWESDWCRAHWLTTTSTDWRREQWVTTKTMSDDEYNDCTVNSDSVCLDSKWGFPIPNLPYQEERCLGHSLFYFLSNLPIVFVFNIQSIRSSKPPITEHPHQTFSFLQVKV